MKWKTIILVSVAAGLTLGGLSLNVNAQERRPNRVEFLERAREKLNLTDEQVEQIKAIVTAEKEAILNLSQKMRSARVELRDVVKNEKSTEKQIRDASAKLAAVQADFAVLRHKVHGKVYPIFTAEQRQQIDEAMDKIDEFVEQSMNRLGERVGK